MGTGVSGQDGWIGNNNITDNAALVYNLFGNQTYGGAITGGGTVTKTGAGLLQLAHSNGYSGGTTVSSGILQLASSTAMGSGGLTANGGTLDLASYSPTVASLQGAAGVITNSSPHANPSTLTVNQAGSTTFNGSFSDPNTNVGLTLGSGTLVLAGGPSTMGVGTILNGGMLQINSSYTVDHISVKNGARLAGNGTINLTGDYLFYSSSAASTFNGQVASSGQGIELDSGAGTLTLTGSNTYTNSTNMNAGMLVAANGGNGSALGTGAVIMSGGTLAAGSAGGTITGLVKPGTGGSAGPYTIAPGADLSSGYGTLNLLGGLNTNSRTTLAYNMSSSPIGGSSTYSGDLINLGSSALNVTAGTITFVSGNPTVLGDYRLFADNNSTITGLSNFALPTNPSGDAYSLNTAVDPGYIDLVLASTSSVATSGGTWTGGSASWTSTANWVSNTVPSSGTVAFAGGSAISVTLDSPQSAGALVFSATNSGGSFTLLKGTNGSLTLGSSAGASINVASGSHEINALVTLANNLVVSGSGILTFGTSGNITDNNAGYSLTMSGSGGGLILSGSDSYTGGTIVSAGTLAATAAAAIPYNQSLTISAGGTFIFDPLATASSLASSQAASPDAVYAVQPASRGVVAAVPEPGTLALLVAGLVAGFAAWRRKRHLR